MTEGNEKKIYIIPFKQKKGPNIIPCQQRKLERQRFTVSGKKKRKKGKIRLLKDIEKITSTLIKKIYI